MRAFASNRSKHLSLKHLPVAAIAIAMVSGAFSLPAHADWRKDLTEQHSKLDLHGLIDFMRTYTFELRRQPGGDPDLLKPRRSASVAGDRVYDFTEIQARFCASESEKILRPLRKRIRGLKKQEQELHEVSIGSTPDEEQIQAHKKQIEIESSKAVKIWLEGAQESDYPKLERDRRELAMKIHGLWKERDNLLKQQHETSDWSEEMNLKFRKILEELTQAYRELDGINSTLPRPLTPLINPADGIDYAFAHGYDDQRKELVRTLEPRLVKSEGSANDLDILYRVYEERANNLLNPLPREEFAAEGAEKDAEDSQELNELRAILTEITGLEKGRGTPLYPIDSALNSGSIEAQDELSEDQGKGLELAKGCVTLRIKSHLTFDFSTLPSRSENGLPEVKSSHFRDAKVKATRLIEELNSATPIPPLETVNYKPSEKEREEAFARFIEDRKPSPTQP